MSRMPRASRTGSRTRGPGSMPGSACRRRISTRSRAGRTWPRRTAVTPTAPTWSSAAAAPRRTGRRSRRSSRCSTTRSTRWAPSATGPVPAGRPRRRAGTRTQAAGTHRAADRRLHRPRPSRLGHSGTGGEGARRAEGRGGPAGRLGVALSRYGGAGNDGVPAQAAARAIVKQRWLAIAALRCSSASRLSASSGVSGRGRVPERPSTGCGAAGREERQLRRDRARAVPPAPPGAHPRASRSTSRARRTTASGKPGQLGHVDAVRAIGAARLEPVEEHDACRPVSRTATFRLRACGQLLGQLHQLVVVGGEHRLAADPVVQVLAHRPGDRDAVVGGGAAADLVEQHQAARGGVVEDRAGLAHLHHEGRLAAGEVVARAHAGEEPVDHADVRRRPRARS